MFDFRPVRLSPCRANAAPVIHTPYHASITLHRPNPPALASNLHERRASQTRYSVAHSHEIGSSSAAGRGSAHGAHVATVSVGRVAPPASVKIERRGAQDRARGENEYECDVGLGRIVRVGEAGAASELGDGGNGMRAEKDDVYRMNARGEYESLPSVDLRARRMDVWITGLELRNSAGGSRQDSDTYVEVLTHPKLHRRWAVGKGTPIVTTPKREKMTTRREEEVVIDPRNSAREGKKARAFAGIRRTAGVEDADKDAGRPRWETRRKAGNGRSARRGVIQCGEGI
ncbi:hypothetical protein B0H11DRAFT_2195635 [Mycena galericulata]|nr:hypothetical protein B0H11DRAFT_2195635 [Mycena galericulata]